MHRLYQTCMYNTSNGKFNGHQCISQVRACLVHSLKKGAHDL